jgi:hypothetical protein
MKRQAQNRPFVPFQPGPLSALTHVPNDNLSVVTGAVQHAPVRGDRQVMNHTLMAFKFEHALPYVVGEAIPSPGPVFPIVRRPRILIKPRLRTPV